MRIPTPLKKSATKKSNLKKAKLLKSPSIKHISNKLKYIKISTTAKHKSVKHKSVKHKSVKHKSVVKMQKKKIGGSFDKKNTKFPRRMSKEYCMKTSCKKMGFSQKASCRYYKNCYK